MNEARTKYILIPSEDRKPLATLKEFVNLCIELEQESDWVYFGVLHGSEVVFTKKQKQADQQTPRMVSSPSHSAPGGVDLPQPEAIDVRKMLTGERLDPKSLLRFNAFQKALLSGDF